MSEQLHPVKRALVSVYDKRGLDALAPALIKAGVEVVSTGSTAKVLADAGVAVTPVSDVTGFPEAFDGRVKTLHPAVHAGLLADLSKPSHVEQLEKLGYAPFQLVIVNLYPFVETVASGAGQADVVEQIDIGGPAMIRAAAKNAESVAVVTSPSRYPDVIAALESGGFDLPSRLRLAAEAFAHTASYDVAVASWLANDVVPQDEGFPLWIGGAWTRSGVLRYGENPHQRAALYARPGAEGIAKAVQHHGKEMSYNNYVDTDAARRAAYDHAEPCVAIIKHANPCGIAIGADPDDPLAEAHRKAHACDPVSAFGGVIATNRPVTLKTAEQISEIFTEVVCAPGYEEGALEVLSRKPSIRLLECPPPAAGASIELRPISGGLLMQEADHIDAPGDDPATWTLQAGDPADAAMMRDLAFAWRAIRAAKSNAILLATAGATVGVGMGQVNRVDAARLAVSRAGDRAAGSVAASDAFFPFPDGFEVLSNAGVKAVVEPGGSVRDEEVIAAAKEAGVTLYFSGTRHFAH
ncbi:MAG TPA: bifunctional phosphoribosylaminoimidazolecarboxamide formyltransferase/IMP cyclohydrolase [Frankiaceae bacterium]|jgi:phosphoribosylaminoimidazolecarboxamide formyltransferase/IMP cyclohydrolase|nr:bifunctional phosphoribosylaminoimidazolecarboxamide formyltransferase/IMP cyclohydrolase [Frankiaceae bacterium]